MAQRNPLNERYTDDEPKGKTRKSAASAKPVTPPAVSVRPEPKKSRKEKKAQAQSQGRKKQAERENLGARGYNVPSQQYQRIRKIWWACLIVALVATIASWVTSRNPSLSNVSITCIFLAYALIIVALYLDFGKMRKIRRAYQEGLLTDRSKEARREQKKFRAEQRQLKKEAEEAYKEAEEEEAAKPTWRERLGLQKKQK